MRFYFFILILVITFDWSCQEQEQDPDKILQTFQRPNTFKGVPYLQDINIFAGETRHVIYNEQLLGILDIKPNNELSDCKLIEMYEPEEEIELFKNLSSSYPITQVTFPEMIKYMEKCDALDNKRANQTSFTIGLGTILSTPVSFFYSILPGTKWCGPGDIAKNYTDLGPLPTVDRCCRAHDLCPVKVRAHSSRYDIDNEDSIISKSHCTCDQIFYECLKRVNTDVTNIIGQIYFNYVHPKCIEEDSSSHKKLVPTKNQY